MFKVVGLTLVIAASTVLGGCASHQFPSRQTQGTVAGGVIGGALGSTIGGGSGQIIATAAGTLIGALVGSNIGGQLDELDRYQAGRVLETAKTGHSQQWVNPDSGNEYQIQPTKTYHSRRGTPCREFIMDAQVGASSEQVYGTACRQADGSWKIKT